GRSSRPTICSTKRQERAANGGKLPAVPLRANLLRAIGEREGMGDRTNLGEKRRTWNYRFGQLTQLPEERRLRLDQVEELSIPSQQRISPSYLSRCENDIAYPPSVCAPLGGLSMPDRELS